MQSHFAGYGYPSLTSKTGSDTYVPEPNSVFFSAFAYLDCGHTQPTVGSIWHSTSGAPYFSANKRLISCYDYNIAHQVIRVKNHF